MPSGGSKGGRRGRAPPGSKFFQFHAVFGKIRQIRMLAPPLGSWRPLLGEILDPLLMPSNFFKEGLIVMLSHAKLHAVIAQYRSGKEFMSEINLNGSFPLCLIITAEYSVQNGNVKSTTLSLCEVIVIPVTIMSISCKTFSKQYTKNLVFNGIQL